MRTKLLLLSCCLLTVGIFSGCTGPAKDMSQVYQRARETSDKADCLSNLKQLSLAMIMFAQDHNETLPDAKTWTDDIRPYFKDEEILRCPSDRGHEYTYAMNSEVSGKKIADMADPMTTVVLFESDAGKKNAADPLKSLCSPPRHAGANNFAYVDGHVKSVSK